MDLPESRLSVVCRGASASLASASASAASALVASGSAWALAFATSSPLNQGHWLRQRGKSRDHLLLFDPLLEVAVAKVSCRL